MNYGEILSKAWKVIWKHKILWLFGVLAGCSAAGGGGGGGGSAGRGASNFTVLPGSPDFIAPSTQSALENFFQFLSSIPWWTWVLLVIGLVALGFILSVLFLMAGTLGPARPGRQHPPCWTLTYRRLILASELTPTVLTDLPGDA